MSILRLSAFVFVGIFGGFLVFRISRRSGSKRPGTAHPGRRTNGNTRDTRPETPEDTETQQDLTASAQSLTETNSWTLEESKNLLSLLYAVAEDKAQMEGTVHRSVSCNHCGTSPIRGYRFKCGNCHDFDLCSSCEAACVHPPNHLFIKIRNQAIYPIVSRFAISLGTRFNEPLIEFSDIERQTHFDQVEIIGIYTQFQSLSTIDSVEGGISKETFERSLGSVGKTKNVIIDRMFLFFDQDRDGIISFVEMVKGLSVLCKDAFKGYDLNGDDLISREELWVMFKAYFKLSMELVRDVVKVVEEGMMENFDEHGFKPVSAAFPVPRNQTSPVFPGKEQELVPSPVRETAQEDEDLTSPLSTVRETLLTLRRNSHASALASPVQEDILPFIETISQDAIESLVEHLFEYAKPSNPQYLTLQDFQKLVDHDMNLLAWFEALGTIF